MREAESERGGLYEERGVVEAMCVKVKDREREKVGRLEDETDGESD